MMLASKRADDGWSRQKAVQQLSVWGGRKPQSTFPFLSTRRSGQKSLDAPSAVHEGGHRAPESLGALLHGRRSKEGANCPKLQISAILIFSAVAEKC